VVFEYSTIELPGLNRIDSQVFAEAAKIALQSDRDSFIDYEFLLDQVSKISIRDPALEESLLALHDTGLIHYNYPPGASSPRLRLTSQGLGSYLRQGSSDYIDVAMSVISLIINEDFRSNSDIQGKLSAPRLVVDHILFDLEQRGYLKLAKSAGGLCHIYTTSPLLKRLLEDSVNPSLEQ
jgi:hypothetical protein